MTEIDRLRQFWDSRYSSFTLSESGWKGAGEVNNQYLYACKTQALSRALEHAGYTGRSRFRVLDAGCGQGFFPGFYQNHYPDVSYTGVDISPKVIGYLKKSFPAYEFFEGDLASWTHPEQRRFDVIQSLEVLHLILDDRLLEAALDGFRTQLLPQGHLLITAVLPDRTIQVNDYIRYRSREYFHQVFARLGLQLVREAPMYYWLPEGGPSNRYIRRMLDLVGAGGLYRLDRLGLALRLPRATPGLDSRMKLLTVRPKPAGANFLS